VIFARGASVEQHLGANNVGDIFPGGSQMLLDVISGRMDGFATLQCYFNKGDLYRGGKANGRADLNLALDARLFETKVSACSDGSQDGLGVMN